jgi:hypothetical protein
MDWFYLIMETEIKPSEIYILLKNSILKAAPNIAAKKELLVAKLKEYLTKFFNSLHCEVSEEEKKSLVLTQEEIDQRFGIERVFKRTNYRIIINQLKKKSDQSSTLLLKSVYNQKDILDYFRRERQKATIINRKSN